MEALDLRIAPPRGPREAIGGVHMMARTVDKIRATLPSRHLGRYLINEGLSAWLLRYIAVEPDALQDIVRSARSDEDVGIWLKENADVSKFEKANAYMSSLKIAELDISDREEFRRAYPYDISKSADAS
jgi:hypothetical protein